MSAATQASGDQAELAHDPRTVDRVTDNVGGYSVPVDPMDLLQCDSCQ